MSGERVFGQKRRLLELIGAILLICLLLASFWSFSPTSRDSLAHRLTMNESTEALVQGRHMLLEWRIERADGRSLSQGELLQVVANAKARLQYGDHGDMDVREGSEGVFTVQLRPGSSLSRERVVRRLRPPGLVRVIPLASSRLPQDQLKNNTEQLWIPTTGALGLPSNHDEIGLVMKPSDSANADESFVLGYDGPFVLTNSNFSSIHLEPATQPTISRIILVLNDSGKSRRKEYPPTYRTFPRNGPFLATSYLATSGLVVDGWLISTVDIVEMALSDELTCIVGFPPIEAEDFAAAMSFPRLDHSIALVDNDEARAN